MKLTRRQLKKLILESIDSEKSGAVVNKLTKEQLEKIKGLLTPYLDTLKDRRWRSLPMIDNIENTEIPEYDTFIQGEQIVHTFLEQKENPGDYPGVVDIYNKILKLYYRNSAVRHLNALGEYVKAYSLYYTLLPFKEQALRTPENFSYETGFDFYKQEKLFRKGMEKLVKIFEYSEPMAPLIYNEKVQPIVDTCDKLINELIRVKESTNSQEEVNKIQKLLDGESAWIRIKNIIDDYMPIIANYKNIDIG